MSCAQRVVGPSTNVGYACTPGAVGFIPNIASCTNTEDLSIAKPVYLKTIPGFACAVSSNFTKSADGVDVLAVSSTNPTSVFQSCCGAGNTKSDNFVSSGYGVTGGPCGYTFCNVTDGAAQDAFMSCLGAKAPGIKGHCFTSYISGTNFISLDSHTPTTNTSTQTTAPTSSATKNPLRLSIVFGFMIAVAGLGVM